MVPVRHYLRDPSFRHFATIPACVLDRQTHGHTDRRGASIASRGIKTVSNFCIESLKVKQPFT